MSDAPNSNLPAEGSAPLQADASTSIAEPTCSAETAARTRIAVARLQLLLETDIKHLHEELEGNLTQSMTHEQRLCARDIIDRLVRFRAEVRTITWDLMPAVQELSRLVER